MKLYAPKYYRDFTCIADRCTHSCCIGWEIDVDDDTIQTYDTLSGEYANVIRQSIDRNDTPHFRLSSNERCPHLNSNGLCNIILAYGEGCLCDICREHPRFYHDTPYGREVGIGMACEEAARIILSSDKYTELIPIETIDGEIEAFDFDATAERDRLYALLSDRTTPYEVRLRRISEQWNVAPTEHTDSKWRSLLDSIEYLDDAHKVLFSTYTSAFTPTESTPILERALAYFLFRHGSDACDEIEFRAALGFSLFCERLLSSLISAHPDLSPVLLARILSEELEYSEENTEEIKRMFF